MGELSLGNLGSDKIVWELSLENFRFGFWLGIFDLESLDWDLGLGELIS